MGNLGRASVIITTFRRNESLLAAINSVLGQTYNDVEVIVVDDNGTSSKYQQDNQRLTAQFSVLPNFIYMPLEVNGGACTARNRGAEMASGEFLFFLDDDDIFLPNKIAYQVNYLQSNPEVDAHLCSMKRMHRNKEILADSNRAKAGDFKNFAMEGNFFTPMMAVRKPAFLECGGFREIQRFQDMYFMLHFLESGKRAVAEDIPLYILNEHDDERVTNASVGKTSRSLHKIRDFVTQFKKTFSPAEWRAFEYKLHRIYAGTLYNAQGYTNHIKSAWYWLRCFGFTGNRNYLKLMAKSFLRLK